MGLNPLTQVERYRLRDLLGEIVVVLEKPPFEALALEDQARWLRVEGERWPSAALLSNAKRPDSLTAKSPSRRFFRRVQKLHHAMFHEWANRGTTILRFADERRVIVLENFDPYDPSSLSWGGSLRQPGDLMILNGNEDLPQGALIMGDPGKITECDICGEPLYKTVWNKKRHSGACQQKAKKLTRKRALRRASHKSGGGNEDILGHRSRRGQGGF